MLFIPGGWFHHVVSYGDTGCGDGMAISVNWWFNHPARRHRSTGADNRTGDTAGATNTAGTVAVNRTGRVAGEAIANGTADDNGTSAVAGTNASGSTAAPAQSNVATRAGVTRGESGDLPPTLTPTPQESGDRHVSLGGRGDSDGDRGGDGGDNQGVGAPTARPSSRAEL